MIPYEQPPTRSGLRSIMRRPLFRACFYVIKSYADMINAYITLIFYAIIHYFMLKICYISLQIKYILRFLHDMMGTTKAKGECEGDANKNNRIMGVAGDDDPALAASMTIRKWNNV